jgi:hypothetical protein
MVGFCEQCDETSGFHKSNSISDPLNNNQPIKKDPYHEGSFPEIAFI